MLLMALMYVAHSLPASMLCLSLSLIPFSRAFMLSPLSLHLALCSCFAFSQREMKKFVKDMREAFRWVPGV